MKHKLPAFDVLVDLARNDPQRLEKLRLKLTGDIIDNAPDEQKRKRLAGLQFRVDMERKRSRSPLQATIKISEMMCQSLAELHRSMVTPFHSDEHRDPQEPAQRPAPPQQDAPAGTQDELPTGKSSDKAGNVLQFPGAPEDPPSS